MSSSGANASRAAAEVSPSNTSLFFSLLPLYTAAMGKTRKCPTVVS